MNKVDELSIDDSCGDEATKLSTIKAITSKIVESTCAKVSLMTCQFLRLCFHS